MPRTTGRTLLDVPFDISQWFPPRSTGGDRTVPPADSQAFTGEGPVSTMRRRLRSRMPQPYRGKPRAASRVVLGDGRAAVLVPRERKHFSTFKNGYPLTEEYLNHLAREGVDAIAIDDGTRLHVFDLDQYRHGDRVGHAPYPMKRVASLEDAANTLEGSERDAEVRAAEWEWLDEADLRPAAERTALREDRSTPGGPRNRELATDTELGVQ